MTRFFERLKVVFDLIPIKARFLKDLGFNISYSGFRYFMQGRKQTPAKKLLEELTSNMGYEYITIPIKLDEEQQQIKAELEDKFFVDLDAYLEKYASDPARIYTKEFGKTSSTADALAAFSDEDIFNPDTKADYSDIF